MTLHVARLPRAWSIAASAWPVDNDAMYQLDGEPNHAWWIGVVARDVSRWYSSSAARSENGLCDDAPAVDALWVASDEAVEVEVWMSLRLGEIERSYMAVARVDQPGKLDLTFEVAPDVPRPQFASDELPARITAIASPLEGSPVAVLPELGILDGGGMLTPLGRVTLAQLAPTRAARREAVTSGPDGRLAIVWSIDQRWHVALYQLPTATPLALVAPDPAHNGNTPHPGRFSDDGRLALVPAGYDALQLLDANTGARLHRWSAGGYVREVATAFDGDRVWIAGHDHARCYDARTGAILEEHRISPPHDPEPAFCPRARRLIWHEVYDYDESESAIVWCDVDGHMGQVLIADALAAPLLVVGDDVVAFGRHGAWRVDCTDRTARRITDPLHASAAIAHAGAVWTTDPRAFRIVIAT